MLSTLARRGYPVCARHGNKALSLRRTLTSVTVTSKRDQQARNTSFCWHTTSGIQVRCLSESATEKKSDDGAGFTTSSAGGVEKREFQAETRMLLDIVAKSLYSRKEVFVRELISNASDALEKLRYLQSVQPDSLNESDRSRALEISINCDPTAKTFTIEDCGVGMSHQDLIDHLGTIARSGSKAFMEKLKTEETKQEALDTVIGRFGVGFYSAFMVADKIDVFTKAAQPEAKAYKWTSDGSGFYEIQELPNPDEINVGTKIVCHLKEDELKYADKAEIERVIKEHSYFVNSPIYVNGERANTQEALWLKRPSECKNEDYESFFKSITHAVSERPQMTLHYQTDVPISINALLFVPDKKPNLMLMDHEATIGVELYSRRILIQAHAKGVLPKWLRFMTGVIDSEDIPLNLSREILQKGAVLEKLKAAVTNKVVSFMESQLKKDRVSYQKFYDDYGIYFKEAILSQVEQSAQKDISRLLLFDSSNCRAGVRTSLQEYVNRMQKEQKAIYYLHVPSREAAEESPFYEAFRHTGMEVLFVTDPADELTLYYLQKFNENQIMSAESWFKSQTDLSDSSDRKLYKDLLAFMELTLGQKRVKQVEVCRRPIEAPCLITTMENESILRSFQRMMDRQMSEEQKIMLMQPKLEINPKHPIIRRLNKMRRDEKELAEQLIEQIWTNAMIQAGLIVDVRRTITKTNELLTKLVERHETETGILTPR